MGLTLFMSAGSEDLGNIVGDVVEFTEILTGRNYPSLEIERHIFDDETHTSVIPAATSRGLVFLFGNR